MSSPLGVIVAGLIGQARWLCAPSHVPPPEAPPTDSLEDLNALEQRCLQSMLQSRAYSSQAPWSGFEARGGLPTGVGASLGM